MTDVVTGADVVFAERSRHILLRIISNRSVVGREQKGVESIEGDEFESGFGVLDVELRNHRIDRAELKRNLSADSNSLRVAANLLNVDEEATPVDQ